MNRLYYGDNLTIMSEWPNACVDLIYLDPPFNSNRQYNAIYKDETGRPLPDQIEAFCDMWELDDERERAIRNMPVLMRENGIDDAIVEFWRLWMNALRGTQPRLLAYLSYMAQRLLVMHRLLKPTGSLYLHCDPTASHYVKALLDAIFGHANFQSEIVWRRIAAHNAARRWGPIHDTIFMYSKSDRYTWNPIYSAYSDDHIASGYSRSSADGRRYKTSDTTGAGVRRGASGEPWRGYNPTEKGRHWAISRNFPGGEMVPDNPLEALDYLDSIGRLHWPRGGGKPAIIQYLDDMPGVPIQDLVLDINPALGDERMGYATQKPVALLERIIAASSNPGDVVLDPFCGCASTLEAAHKLGRGWLGIDIAIHAVKRVARLRLEDRLGLMEGQHFSVEGVPRTIEGAQDLWERDKYHFQKWAVEQAEGFVTTRKAADGGVDGRIYYAVPHAQDLQSMVVEVKGGRNVSIADVRALKGVLDYDSALMAGLIILHPLGDVKERNFRRFMADAGTVDLWGNDYPRMQILTVDEILEGKRFATPTIAGRHTEKPRFPGMPTA